MSTDVNKSASSILAPYTSPPALRKLDPSVQPGFIRGSDTLQHGLVDPRLKVTVGLGKVFA